MSLKALEVKNKNVHHRDTEQSNTISFLSVGSGKIFGHSVINGFSALKGTFSQPRAMPWDRATIRFSDLSRPFHPDEGHTHSRPFPRSQGMALG